MTENRPSTWLIALVLARRWMAKGMPRKGKSFRFFGKYQAR